MLGKNTILQTLSYSYSLSRAEKRISGHQKYSGIGCKCVCSSEKFFNNFSLRVSHMVFIFVKGILSPSIEKRNKEGATINCLCYGMTIIIGFGMALYVLNHFCKCHFIMMPCKDHGKDLGLNIGSVR